MVLFWCLKVKVRGSGSVSSFCILEPRFINILYETSRWCGFEIGIECLVVIITSLNNSFGLCCICSIHSYTARDQEYQETGKHTDGRFDLKLLYRSAASAACAMFLKIFEDIFDMFVGLVPTVHVCVLLQFSTLTALCLVRSYVAVLGFFGKCV